MAVYSIYSAEVLERRRRARPVRPVARSAPLLALDAQVVPGGVRVVRVGGEVDASTSPALVAEATRLAAPGVVLDLHGVEFLGIAGLHGLERIAAWAERNETVLRLAACSRPVERALEVSGLAGRFATCDRVETAAQECIAS